MFFVADDSSEMIRVRLGTGLRTKWKQVLDDRKISQQKAVVSLVEWIVSQDPLVQAMIFDQVPAADRGELSRIVLKRLAEGGGKPRKSA